MRKTTFTRILLALSCICAMLIATPGNVSAQPNCCNPTIDIRNVPATCFPLAVSVSLSGIVTTHTLSANGVYPNLPFLSTSACPAFDWVSLDGGITKITLGMTKTVKANNCCFTVSAALITPGCVYITINGITLTPC